MAEALPTRKARRYIRHRDEILAAARTLFAEHGFHNVTMQQIAQAAEFSVGKIYTFFANKEALYEALIKEKAQEIHDEIHAILAGDADALTLILAANLRKIELFLNNTETIRLILSETAAAGYALRVGLNREIRAQYDALLQALGQLFASGIRNGVFIDGDPYLYAVALDGMTNAMVLAQMELAEPRPADITAVCRSFINGILTTSEGEHV